MNFSTLNKEQREAVVHPGGPMIIFAGAGTGKTRTLTHRIAYLIEKKGVPANRIFAATYTVKATKEMKERIKDLTGTSQVPQQISTLHSVCRKILKIDGSIMGIDSCFRSFGKKWEKEKLLKEIMGKLDIALDPEDVGNDIAVMKIFRSSPASLLPEIGRIYGEYQKYLKQENYLDYEDQLVEAVNLLRCSGSVRNRWNSRFSHIFIDEFQDTNQAQYELVKILAERHNNICAVGDDDQTIYSFAGATVDRMLNFKKDYPDATTFYLGQNYRSTGNIIEIANRVISLNKKREKKELRTDKAAGAQITSYCATSRNDEACWIAEQISKLYSQGVAYSEIKILSRRNPITFGDSNETKNRFTSIFFEKASLKQGIPFCIPSARRLYQKSEIKNLISYLQVINNPEQSLALVDVMKIHLHGIDERTIRLLRMESVSGNTSLWKVLLEIESDSPYLPQEIKQLQSIVNFIKELQLLALKTQSIQDLLEDIIRKTNYREFLRNRDDKYGEFHIRNVDNLIDKAASFDEGGFHRYTKGISFVKYFLDIILPEKENNDVIQWMTLHSTKGLEFPNVFLVSVDDGIFPDERNELEEERRLFYVGITRAQERLFISSSQSSQFLNEAESMPVPHDYKEPLQVMSTEKTLSSTSIKRTPERLQNNRNGEDILTVPLMHVSHAGDHSPTKGEATAYASKVTATTKVLLPTPIKKPLQEIQEDSKSSRTLPAEKIPELPIYQIGDRVRHPKFGEGNVIEISPANSAGSVDVIRVHFDSGDDKKLAWRVAPIEKLNKTNI